MPAWSRRRSIPPAWCCKRCARQKSSCPGGETWGSEMGEGAQVGSCCFHLNVVPGYGDAEKGSGIESVPSEPEGHPTPPACHPLVSGSQWQQWLPPSCPLPEQEAAHDHQSGAVALQVHHFARPVEPPQTGTLDERAPEPCKQRQLSSHPTSQPMSNSTQHPVRDQTIHSTAVMSS